MAKKIKTMVKLQIPAGSANPAPPIGPALSPHGVQIKQFCDQFNDKTKTIEKGMTIPVVITVYQDRSFSFITKMPPVSALIRKAAKIAKGSGIPNKDKVGSISAKQVEEIAKEKMPDLNTNELEPAKLMVMGTARSMGVEVK